MRTRSGDGGRRRDGRGCRTRRDHAGRRLRDAAVGARDRRARRGRELRRGSAAQSHVDRRRARRLRLPRCRRHRRRAAHRRVRDDVRESGRRERIALWKCSDCSVVQALAVACTIAFTAPLTALAFCRPARGRHRFAFRCRMRCRGVDVSEHGEHAYDDGDSSPLHGVGTRLGDAVVLSTTPRPRETAAA